jgi:hypothetical protein
MEASGILKIHGHPAGFFSCCSRRLIEIIEYFKNKKHMPSEVDSSLTFIMYKPSPGTDITNIFFKDYHEVDIAFNYARDFSGAKIMDPFDQFHSYKTLDFKHITPFVKKYFTPSSIIQSKVDALVSKYNIFPDNCVGVYYRGTDKISETQLGSYDSYYLKIKELVDANPKIQILVQSDAAPFIDFLKSKSLPNIIIITENYASYATKGIHYEKTAAENYADIQTLMATLLIITKCKYIICSSGNGSVWMMYLRGNAQGVMQNLHCNWM